MTQRVRVCKKFFPPGCFGNKNRLPGFQMDYRVAKGFSKLKKVIKKDWDMFFVVDGNEGTGKSVLAQQLAAFCDPTFCVDRIVFRAEEFKDAVLKAGKYQAIIFDEAYGGLASRKAMSSTNHMLVDLMAEIRQRNLFIFMVLPSFFELDKYAAVHRTRYLIHTYHNKFNRGYYHIYNDKQKQKMYLLGKKIYKYNIIKKPAVRCAEFRAFYPVPKAEYIKKKADSLRAGMEADKTNLDNPNNKEVLETAKLRKTVYGMTNKLSAIERGQIGIDLGFGKSFISGQRSKFKKDEYGRDLLGQDIEKKKVSDDLSKLME